MDLIRGFSLHRDGARIQSALNGRATILLVPEVSANPGQLLSGRDALCLKRLADLGKLVLAGGQWSLDRAAV
ncbi:hypothetical protein [Streptomyces sp. NPDC055134]